MSATRTGSSAKSSKRKASHRFLVTITDSGGRRACAADLRDALKNYAFDPDIGGKIEIKNMGTVALPVNARKAVPKKIAPLLFTVRVNTGEKASQKAERIKAVAVRLSLDGTPPVRAVRAKALDNAKGTAFTLKVPIESNKVKARLVAQEVQMAVADSFGEYATVKRQYESR